MADAVPDPSGHGVWKRNTDAASGPLSPPSPPSQPTAGARVPTYLGAALPPAANPPIDLPLRLSFIVSCLPPPSDSFPLSLTETTESHRFATESLQKLPDAPWGRGQAIGAILPASDRAALHTHHPTDQPPSQAKHFYRLATPLDFERHAALLVQIGKTKTIEPRDLGGGGRGCYLMLVSSRVPRWIKCFPAPLSHPHSHPRPLTPPAPPSHSQGERTGATARSRQPPGPSR